jgi:hypothetical protein
VNLWVLDEIKLYQGDTRLTSTEKEGVKISLPSNMAFNSYDDVLSHFSSPPLSDDIDLFWRQANVDVQVTYLLAGDDQSFSIETRLSGLGLRTVSAVMFTTRDDSRYQYDFIGDPGLLNLNPDWLQVINQFVGRGFLHILNGLDHLLFLVALIAPVTKVRPLIVVVTAFTLGHSLTLAVAVLGYIPDSLWFPVSIELLVALTILFLAIDNIFVGEKKRRWVYGLLFGLIHGLAFSFALSQSLQYSGNHLVVGLLGFNLGVEFGQLLVLAIILPVFVLLRRLIQRERLMLGLVSLTIAHTSLHWIQDRWEILAGYF